MALLSAVSSSLKVACYANSVTPTLISPILSKRFAWPSMMNLNKEGRQGSRWSVPTCLVAACNALRGTRNKPKPALVVKNFRKLWSTNWRIKPSVSLEAPNSTSPPPCSSPCSRLFATPRLQVFLLIEILPSTSSNTSVIPACPSRASFFFLLHAAKVRSSCEEGPGQSALQSAYHNPKLDVTELKQNRTP